MYISMQNRAPYGGSMPRGFWVLILCGCFPIAQAQSFDIGARTQYFPDTTDGIHLEMVFNYNVPDPSTEAGVVDMVWGTNYASQPAGVYNTSSSVDNFTHSVAWYSPGLA
jgi:hypothetical protein